MSSEPKLLDQVGITARLRHLSLSTEKAYVQHIKRFIIIHPRIKSWWQGRAQSVRLD